ncbi:MAG: hypothetical protein EKK29_18795 [Hyphomicrobiales bacterium]|nr:MAG: hypothetical protein EKK29_18795 [Hyphomicrobiales bacterium]
MLAEKEVAAQFPSMDTDPIFIAIEMSRLKWLVGTHLPASAKIGIHAMDWGDTAALFALIDRLKLRAAKALRVAARQSA